MFGNIRLNSVLKYGIKVNQIVSTNFLLIYTKLVLVFNADKSMT